MVGYNLWDLTKTPRHRYVQHVPRFVHKTQPRALLRFVGDGYQRISSIWCWNYNIPGQLDQHHGSWCPGSLRRHVVVSNQIVSTMFGKRILVFHDEGLLWLLSVEKHVKYKCILIYPFSTTRVNTNPSLLHVGHDGNHTMVVQMKRSGSHTNLEYY